MENLAVIVTFKTYTLDEWKGDALSDLHEYEDFIVSELIKSVKAFVEGGGRWEGYWLASRFMEGIITTPAASTKLSTNPKYWKVTQMKIAHE